MKSQRTQQKSKYRVFIICRSLAILPSEVGKIKIDYGTDSKTTILLANNRGQNILGHPFCNGVKVVVELIGEDILSAANLARSQVEQILNLLSLSAGASTYKAIIYNAYDISEGNLTRDYLQIYHSVLEKVGNRVTAISSLETIFNALNKSKELSERIGLASHWYRQAILTSDPIDRFLSIWTALETLNPLVQEKHSAGKESAKCPRCGYIRKQKGTTGIKWLFSQIESNGERIYSKARDIRVKLIHSFVPIYEIYNDVCEILEPSFEALRKGMAVCLGIPIERIPTPPPIDKSLPVMLLFFCQLGNLNIDIEDPKYKHPEFSLEIQMQEKNGGILILPTFSTDIISQGVGIGGMAINISDNHGYPINFAQITLKSPKRANTGQRQLHFPPNDNYISPLREGCMML